jgi:hypothetical protein
VCFCVNMHGAGTEVSATSRYATRVRFMPGSRAVIAPVRGFANLGEIRLVASGRVQGLSQQVQMSVQHVSGRCLRLI